MATPDSADQPSQIRHFDTRRVDVPHFDVAIIGSGSGNSVVSDNFEGKRVAVIEEATFGGTCLNVGCIPTKMYVYSAEVARGVTEAARYGIDASLDRIRWPDIRDRIFGRIDPISAAGRTHRAQGPNTTLFQGHATFVEQHRLRVTLSDQPGPVELTADQIVIAAGAHPVIPTLISDSGAPFHTSDTVLRLEELPAQLLVLGGGYIAAELASVFGAFGSEITLVNRGPALLQGHDADVVTAFTEHARKQFDVRLSTTVTDLARDGSGVRATLSDGSVVSAAALLVATGRRPSTQSLGLDAVGIDCHPDGRVVVDAHGRTGADGVWALGDVSSLYQLKHVANHEARVVAHNVTHPDQLRSFDHRFVPSAVFTDPQIASVGLTEQQARDRGLAVVTATQRFSDTAYGWAMEDREGFCKVIADRNTAQLVGAHLMGHQASILIQPLIQMMSLGQTVTEVARGQYWIHPALSEVVENALLKLGLG